MISNNEIVLNDGDGILFCSCGDGGSAIYGNLIGTNASGTVNLGNKGYGINIGSANNTVGGTTAGEANVIAFNTKAGVGLEKLNTDTGNMLSANSIYSNQTLGIDLGETGVPLQDNGGVSQSGPNDLENYPVLTDCGRVDQRQRPSRARWRARPTRRSRSSFSATRRPILPATARVNRSSVPRR